MDGFYRGIETSLLAMSLALVVTVAALAGTQLRPAAETGLETTLPMITVTSDGSGE